ncbi:MAG: hypothetical protein WD184_11115 [Acidimicrobiia bacterium]
MRSFTTRLRNALIVSIVATAVSLPITALAALPPIDLPRPIDLPGVPNHGCGNGKGQGNDCSHTTTTTTPEPVPTTVPVTVPTTVPVTVPTTVPASPSTTAPGGGPGTVPATVPATTVPVPPATPPGQTATPPGQTATPPGQTATPPGQTATTVGNFPATLPAVVPSTHPGDARAEPAGPAVVTPVGTPPVGTPPVGTPPVGTPPVGLSGFNTAAMAPQMAGAVKMLEGRDDEAVDDEPVADVAAGPMSGGFHDLLSPVLPPALVDAVASPLVIMDALYDAFTSSGQALIVPGIAFLFGFGVPGIRRRITLDEVID